MDFNNNTTGSYSWSQIHGLYCTVGIEDHTMTRGLQYTFNNQYPTAAMPLSNNTAILITTEIPYSSILGDLNHQDASNNFSKIIVEFGYLGFLIFFQTIY